jgi:hypothetical protein
MFAKMTKFLWFYIFKHTIKAKSLLTKNFLISALKSLNKNVILPMQIYSPHYGSPHTQQAQKC